MGIKRGSRLEGAVGRYVVSAKEPLGSNLGMVWAAVRVSDGCGVVVKTIGGRGGLGAEDLRIESEEHRLLYENLPSNSPVVVPWLDAGELDGAPFFVVQFYDGTLGEWFTRRPCCLRSRLELLASLALATRDFHEKLGTRGRIHRDIKPANLVVFLEGDHAAVRFIDLGCVAQATQQPYAATPSWTAGFAPLEQACVTMGPDAWFDVHAVAASLFAALAGGPPVTIRDWTVSAWDGSGGRAPALPADWTPLRASIHREIDEALARWPGASPHVAAALRRLLREGLEPDPAARRRPQPDGDLWLASWGAELRGLARTMPPVSWSRSARPRPPPPPPPSRWAGRTRIAIGAGVTLVSVLSAVAGIASAVHEFGPLLWDDAPSASPAAVGPGPAVALVSGDTYQNVSPDVSPPPIVTARDVYFYNANAKYRDTLTITDDPTSAPEVPLRPAVVTPPRAAETSAGAPPPSALASLPIKAAQIAPIARPPAPTVIAPPPVETPPPKPTPPPADPCAKLLPAATLLEAMERCEEMGKSLASPGASPAACPKEFRRNAYYNAERDEIGGPDIRTPYNGFFRCVP